MGNLPRGELELPDQSRPVLVPIFGTNTIRPAADRHTVAGGLTVRGTTRPVYFDAVVSGDEGEIMLDAEVLINRADYGRTFSQLGMMATKCTITVHAVFTKQ